MAEYLSERELRKILRSRARERQLQEEEEKKNARRMARNERSHQESSRHEQIQIHSVLNNNAGEEVLDTEPDRGHYYKYIDNELDIAYGRMQYESDSDSELSNLNTIDEYLHEETRRSIQNSLREKKSIEGTTLSKDTESVESNLAYINRHIEDLNLTLKELQEKGEGNLQEKLNVENEECFEENTYEGNIERGETERVNTNERYDSWRYVSERSNRMTDTKGEKKNEQIQKDIDMKLSKIRKENDDIKSHSSRYERESLKLRKLQLEEEKHRQLMLENELKLQEEIDRKRKSEKELLERIKLLEEQECDLNSKRNENEILEREISAKKVEDEALNQKITLLKEKERLLTQKAETQVKDKDAMKKDKVERQIIKVDRERKDEYPAFKLGSPKIPSFDGTHFENWKMEVNCLLQTKMYPDYAILQAIRNSLKDETRQVLLTLKATATSREIMDKLSEIYGDIKTEDKVVQDFYSAKQKQGETISAWGVRVETLFQKAVDKGEIEERKRDKKLKERFWRGLKSEKLKFATRVFYESTDSFEKLRRKTRLEEEEDSKDLERERSEQIKINALQEKKIDEKLGILQELLERMKTMESDIGKLKHQNQYRNQSNQGRDYQRRPFRGGYRGRRFEYRDRRSNGDQTNDRNRENKGKHDDKEQSTDTRIGKNKSDKQNLNGDKLPSEGPMEARK
ncbi:trichohyalin-like [Mercenaria mercenaria]|uniref:trichohyalin-like n=1 Tax=Mercenaria mercenaria TaxID=6596 RepID=UPI00234E5907|nr:trichohyalin-like [Mercenaria mercenaria]